MSDVWMVGPTALAIWLRGCGFSPREAECLVALKLRYVRGGFRELTNEQKRLRFARWLVDHGWLDEGFEETFEEEGAEDQLALRDKNSRWE
jgi:hypothetical protein